MRKFFTLFAALVCGMAMNAKTLYVNPGTGENNWAKDGAVLFVHSWGAEDSDAKLTTLSGEILSAEIPDGNNSLLFVRMPGGSTAIDWNTKWNQTNDLSIPSGKNMYTFTGWGGSDGEWSVYSGSGDDPVTPPTPQPSDAYWYWKGQVDGGAIENEAGGFNIFNGGMSSISVGDAAYVFVIYQEHGVQGVQYMTDGWLGFEVTHATLNACGDCPNGNKLYLPAGDHTLYLYDNGNGTVELSREELPGKTLVGGGQGIEDNFVKEKAHKTIIDGQLRIVRGDKVFDATGRQIQ